MLTSVQHTPPKRAPRVCLFAFSRVVNRKDSRAVYVPALQQAQERAASWLPQVRATDCEVQCKLSDRILRNRFSTTKNYNTVSLMTASTRAFEQGREAVRAAVGRQLDRLKYR